MILLGIDLGSSSLKASLVDGDDGRVLGSGQYPPIEMSIDAPQPGWAEQDPADWEDAARRAVHAALKAADIEGSDVGAIGIAYQMHGLVCMDKKQRVLRPSIIWCDSRAVSVGRQAFEELGPEQCLTRLLNAPGNFTAAKLAWVKRHEPEVFAQIDHICLPGDYLAARLTGRVATTVSGLSEGMLWDFDAQRPAKFLLQHWGMNPSLLAELVPTFGEQGMLTAEAAEAFGLRAGTPVTYRAGDQPNNALSLNVLNAGEIAATAGTSGVVYGVSDRVQYDPQSRINSFAHVNHAPGTGGNDSATRIGLLLCINGTGIANAFARRLLAGDQNYNAFNDLASKAPVGSAGLSMLPFGNGAERMLGNAEVGAHLSGLDFNRHGQAEIARAVQEGIAFSFRYGMDILRETGVDLGVIRAGRANLFQSRLFVQTLATASDIHIELYNTDGAIGAARGAGIGVGYYASPQEAFASLQRLDVIEPAAVNQDATRQAYQLWVGELLDRLHA